MTITYCKRCVMSNRRPCSYPEHLHRPDRNDLKTMHIDEEGICDACRYAERKEKIDWKEREAMLCDLLDVYRSTDGQYDCIVPGSGGKDSFFAAYTLKEKFGMHPLTVTWPPLLYTDYGYRNFMAWTNLYPNITVRPNGNTHRLLTKLALTNLLHPFQPFILGQKNVAPRIAKAMGIPLVIYGEPEAEYGNPIIETMVPYRDKRYYASDNKMIHLAGVPVDRLLNMGLQLSDLAPYMPLTDAEGVDVRYLGYYIKWTPQEAYYQACDLGFNPRPFRTEGTYSKYNSIDDKIDDLHYYTTYIKFGLGRTSYDASQEIRNNHLTRNEGVALVKKFDGEYPKRYLGEVLEYLGMDQAYFDSLCDQWRSPDIWEKENGTWRLRYPVWET